MERQESILVLRQAQDEDEWEICGLTVFLMLSLSKHEEVPLPLLPRFEISAEGLEPALADGGAHGGR